MLICMIFRIVVRPCLTKAPIFSATPLVASVRTSRTTSLRPPLVVSTYCSFSSTLMSRLMAKLTGMHRSPKEVIVRDLLHCVQSLVGLMLSVSRTLLPLLKRSTQTTQTLSLRAIHQYCQDDLSKREG